MTTNADPGPTGEYVIDLRLTINESQADFFANAIRLLAKSYDEDSTITVTSKTGDGITFDDGTPWPRATRRTTDRPRRGAPVKQAKAA